MKRSTLTLSILTALLVSACGGSSSNDEQTKDPTPPKVTPTNPSTPSTGKTTPTTGNKDNAGSSGSSAGSSSSSSSSDPTPPISSGSAPSGGKPIVVTPTKPEQKPDPDEPTDPDEPAAGSLAAAQEAFEKAEQDWVKAKGDLQAATSAKRDLWKQQDEKLQAIATGLDINLAATGGQPNARLESIKAKMALPTTPADKKEAAEKALKAYETMKKSWETAKEKEKAAQTALEKAKETKFTAKRDLALEEVKAGLAKSDDVKSAKDYFDAKEKQAKAQFKVDEAQLKLDQFAAQKAQLKNDQNVLKDEKKDLEAAITIAGNDEKLKAKLEKQKENVVAEIAKLGEKIEVIEADETLAKAEKKRYQKDVLPESEFKELEKIAGNRGVAGGSDLSSKNFVEIQVAELNETGKKWTLTFKDDTKAEIDMENPGQTTGTLKNQVKKTGSGNDVIYAYFGKVGEKITAFNPSKADGASIYGYIGDKFYSVGKVTEADVVDKIKDGAVVYNGKALLSASGKGLVSTFTGTANFNDNTFNGSFKEFASYDRTKTDSNVTVVAVPEDLKGKLPETVDFESKISDNKFEAKIIPNKANVYGFFYGKDTDEKPAEVGGLVEYKDLFHGSFGGAKQE